MILRSLTKHVRDQNWFAFGLDFFIVVFGVFIGLQMQNWNAARNDRARAEVYSDRLMDELGAELECAISIVDYHASLRGASNIAFAGLAAKEELADEAILVNAFRASQYNWYERRRSTFDEIVASGSLALITDDALRETASGIYSTPIFSITQAEGQSSHYRKLFRMAIKPSMHDALSRNCGDREYESNSSAVGLVTLNYDCVLDANADEITEAVRALRSDPDILRALKLRHAEVTSRTIDLELTLRTSGINKLLAKEVTP